MIFNVPEEHHELHHHHGSDGKVLEHRHSLMFEGRLGVENDPRFTGPLNCAPFHEHFEIEGARCPFAHD